MLQPGSMIQSDILSYSEIHHESNKLYLEQLFQDIENGLISMQNTINIWAQIEDTLDKRRKFIMTQIDVNRKFKTDFMKKLLMVKHYYC